MSRYLDWDSGMEAKEMLLPNATKIQHNLIFLYVMREMCLTFQNLYENKILGLKVVRVSGISLRSWETTEQSYATQHSTL